MKIRIRLQAYDHRVLDTAVKKISEVATRSNARVIGPVPLPTRKQRFTVIRSPHKDKDSREHFEMRTHRRIIDLDDVTPRLTEALQRIELPAEVQVTIKVLR